MEPRVSVQVFSGPNGPESTMSTTQSVDRVANRGARIARRLIPGLFGEPGLEQRNTERVRLILAAAEFT